MAISYPGFAFILIPIGRESSMVKNILTLFIGLVWLLGLQLSTVRAVYGQSGATTGTIVGVVSDASGAVIAGSAINARQLDTNITRTVQTDERGKYLFIQMAPGKYEITV